MGDMGIIKVDVFNMQGEKVKTVELPAEIFEAKVNIDLMHQAFIQQMANARLGTHKTKLAAKSPVVVVNPGNRRGPAVLVKGPPEPRIGFMVAGSIHHAHASTLSTYR